MLLPSHPDFHLTYCTNIHPADGWEAVLSSLKRHAPALRRRFSPDSAFGIGLRLSAHDATGLLSGSHLSDFRRFLDDEGLYVAVINGFPYGPFHGTPVKASVYAPDWREPARLSYTFDLVRILQALLPEGVDGGVSTAPLSYKPWMAAADAAAWETIARQVVRVAERMARVRRDTGALIHLDIEPEPDCSIENTAETLDFFEHRLLPFGTPLLAQSMSVTESVARELLLEHIRVCFDCCHFAVEFEDSAAALDRMRALGIKIGRVQLSSALDVDVPADKASAAAIIDRLRPFADATYLHQVVERRGENLRHYLDLPDVLERGNGESEARTWRIHFHVPLFTAEYGALSSTQAYVANVLRQVIETRATTHLEIETYTWDVLPSDLKLDSLESIAREYEWVPPRAQGFLPMPAPRAGRERNGAGLGTPASEASEGVRGKRGEAAIFPRNRMKTVVLNVVALTADLIARGAPALAKWARDAASVPVEAAFPAVTCSAQSDYLTGVFPNTHGVVGNGWYVHDDCEIRFWRQSNRLVQAPKIWDIARAEDPSFTCANMFWWFNMYSSADISVTPRPMYPADGRKLPDVYSHPSRLRGELQARLGTFPLFDFWGPRASIASTRWVAEASKLVEEESNPTLTLIYLPHLDYNLQRVGPSHPAALNDVRQVDEICADLIGFYEKRGASVVVLSEYGIRDVSRPVHINRALRERGLISVREELGHELLDPGASAAFAVADHQVAHLYVNDRTRLSEVRSLVESLPGVERVLDASGKADWHIDHARSGDLVAIASPNAWFTYYYWLDDARAADFARTVEIHRKPGYDPVELFLDPDIRVPALTVGWKIARRKLGFRTLLDVIPLDATLVKGSHGRRAAPGDIDAPIFLTKRRDLAPASPIRSVDVQALLLRHLST